MTKIVINTCFGGFGLSQEALARLRELGSPYVGEWAAEELKIGGWPDGPLYLDSYTNDREIPRHDPLLVQVVEELGSRANGNYAQLRVVEIPGALYRVSEYDGREHVETPEKLNWIDATLAPKPVEWA